MKNFAIQGICDKFAVQPAKARVAELVDALDSKSCVLNRRAGSSPASGTRPLLPGGAFIVYPLLLINGLAFPRKKCCNLLLVLFFSVFRLITLAGELTKHTKDKNENSL